MKIVYMGTPEFAVPPFEALLAAGHEIALAVTQPDRKKDRKGNLLPTPVRNAAEAHGIRCVQPEKIRNNETFAELLRGIGPDAIIVAAYGRILPPELLSIPKHGCINIHASLLPKYRGPSPIQTSIVKGEEFTGISIMQMDEGLDTGDILATRKVRIDRKDAAALQDELSEIGAVLIVETLDAIENGTVGRIKQDDAAASLTHIIKKQDGCIDFHKSPVDIERIVRGMHPWPGAYAFFEGEQIRILEADALDDECIAEPGTILGASGDGIDIVAGGSILRIRRLQAAGRKAMGAAEFLRGRKLEAGSVMECKKE